MRLRLESVTCGENYSAKCQQNLVILINCKGLSPSSVCLVSVSNLDLNSLGNGLIGIFYK